jgi:hypothetical protein
LINYEQIKKVNVTRLCREKSILTVNVQFPGPTICARKGDVVVMKVHNHGDRNITIHWHGVKQPRNPWSDGPEYITQCPIRPGRSFAYRVILSEEEGTRTAGSSSTPTTPRRRGRRWWRRRCRPSSLASGGATTT